VPVARGRRGGSLLAAAALATALLRASPARGEGAPPAPARVEASSRERFELARVEPATFAFELAALGALGAGALLLGEPERCRWCEPPGFDTELHAPASAENRHEASAGSGVLAYAVLPAAALSAVAAPAWRSADPDRHALENVAIVLEAALLDWTLTRVAKSLVARERPAFHYGRAGDGQFGDSPGEANQSFFSADASLAFAVVSAASTVSFQRGYASAPYVAAAGGLLASTAAWLRVRADVHWPSDVLTGALVGSAVGAGWPLLAHPRRVDGALREIGVVPRWSPEFAGMALRARF
jgi:hypothetical protein